ncbi:hypothetical protein ScPMuIL_013140 [Solemya velum]
MTEIAPADPNRGTLVLQHDRNNTMNSQYMDNSSAPQQYVQGPPQYVQAPQQGPPQYVQASQQGSQQYVQAPQQVPQSSYQSPIPPVQNMQMNGTVHPPPNIPMSPYQQHPPPYLPQGELANPSKLEVAMDKGFQYGSDYHQKLQAEQPRPRPIRDPFGEKTSAEVGRIRQQQMEAEDDIQKHREDQQRKMAAREQEKKKYDLRKQKFTEHDLSPRNKLKYRDPTSQDTERPTARQQLDEVRKSREDQQRDDRQLAKQEQRIRQLKHDIDLMKTRYAYSKGGGGAPHRTESGTLLLKKKMYNTNDPFELIHVQARGSFAERRARDTYDPWGKGCGNPPGTQQVDREGDEIFKITGQNHDTYDPWGKGIGQPTLDSKGNAKRHKSTHNGFGLWDLVVPKETSMDVNGGEPDLRRGGIGARTAPENGRRDQYFDLRTKGLRQRMSNQEHSNYYPFGRAGGGAPNKDKEGNILTTVYGTVAKETTPAEQKRRARGAQNYLQELQKEMVEQQRNRDHMNNFYKVPGFDDLASRMNQGQVGKPRRDPVTGMLLNHHLPNSDVSLQKVNFQPRGVDDKRQYHDDLENLAEDRFRRRQVDNLRDRQESRLHYDTMGEYWGKFGGGAPKARNDFKKKNLVDIIHSPREKDSYRDYNKVQDPVKDAKENLPTMFGPSGYTDQQKFLRSTVNSHHVNLYEYPEAAVGLDRRTTNEAPFALHG